MKPQIGPYPKNKPSVGTLLMTQYGEIHHTNELPYSKAALILQMAENGYKGYDDLNHILGSLCVLLSDVPAEPLLSADANRKGSALGAVSTTYLLHHPQHGPRVRRIINSGNGVMILRVYGEMDLSRDEFPIFETKIELFDDWPSYQEFIVPFVATHDLTASRNDSIFS